MSYQDNFYKKKESNAYFSRVIKNSKFEKGIRESKKNILNELDKNINLKNKNVLEIGCFVADLLNVLKKKYNCKVDGIEPSSLACDFAKKNFSLIIENSTFAKSSKFLCSQKNFSSYDLIIVDDVLSWIDRDLILQTISSLDWLLKSGGYIYLRDFSPNFSFAVKNHHWKNQKIFNFKQTNGHKTFFLNSGKYKIILSRVYETKMFNKVKTSHHESNIWNNVILKKIKNFTQPIIKL